MNRAPSITDWDRLVSEIIATQIELTRTKMLLIKTNSPIGILAGSPVTLTAGLFALGTSTLGAIGLSNVQDATSTVNITAIRQGNLILTTDQWDLVTGDIGGLIPNTVYWITATGITKTRPVSGNVYQIGVAISSTVLSVSFQASP